MIDRYLHQIMAGSIRRKGIRTINLLFWRPLFYHWNNSPILYCQTSSGSWCLYGRLLCFTTSLSTGLCLARFGINQPFISLCWDDVLCTWLRVCSSLNAKGWPIDLSNLGCHVKCPLCVPRPRLLMAESTSNQSYDTAGLRFIVTGQFLSWSWTCAESLPAHIVQGALKFSAKQFGTQNYSNLS